MVIAYDNGPGAMAARCWWLLRWFGHKSVYVLDGGLDAWIDSGGVLVDGAETYPTAEFNGRPQQNRCTDADMLMRAVDDPGQLIIDARENKRFLVLD
jgi:thiosulfate/3-mercaptopyruvate sulfurtransferase